MEFNHNPDGFIRLKEVLKIIPVSQSTWWRKVKSGEFPKGYNLGRKCVAWRVRDIQSLIEKIGSNSKAEGKDMT